MGWEAEAEATNSSIQGVAGNGGQERPQEVEGDIRTLKWGNRMECLLRQYRLHSHLGVKARGYTLYIVLYLCQCTR